MAAPASKKNTKKAPAPAAPAKKVAAKPAVKAAASAASKATLKSAPKKDVKTPAGSKVKASGKSGAVMAKAATAKVDAGKAAAAAKNAKPSGKAGTPAKGVELKVKAGKGSSLASNPEKALPMTKAQLAKAAKVAKAQAAAARALEDACREIACESSSTTAGYCRLHYIKNWKKIKRKELILREKKLNQYIEELVAKYPDKYIEAIKQDLSDEKAFSKVIYDLELDESVDDVPVDEDSDDNIVESIKRDFDDGDTDF